MRSAVTAVVLLAAFVPAAPAQKFRDGRGLDVVRAERIDERLWEVEVATSVLRQPVDVRILLPRGYASSRRRYPVLHLYHGTSGRASDWTTMGDAARTTDGLPLIVVMPDAGYDGDGGGWFTNWFNQGEWGVPEWETFHIGQLLPWVDDSLRTVARRRGRAVYGLSQGGFGSMSYAARHPHRFVAAGAYSGAVETTADAQAQVLTTPVIQATSAGLNGAHPDAIFGPRSTQQVNWAAHDPGTLAANLRGMDLRLFTGDGSEGPLDDGSPDPASTAIEAGVHELNELLVARLRGLGIAVAYHDYGPGTHTWPYWARDLRETVGPLMRLFRDPPAPPRPIAYRSAENPWSAWGYRVRIERPAREFSRLEDARSRGFALTGSGEASVRTPPHYRPRARARAHLTAPGLDEVRRLRVGRRGRLRITVPLGPGNPHQQFTPEAAAAGGTREFTAHVRIRAPRRR